MGIKRFNVKEEGLQRFFGPLEARVMKAIWEHQQLTIKQVHELLDDQAPISLNAVMTVMLRLTDKGILRKETTGGGRNRVSFFFPVQSEEQFIVEQTRVVTEGLMEDFGPLIVNHFIDQLDSADPELIKKLESRINELKKQ
ncbi:BlaI/MecI/CopY family transcriptional regulator [Paenibacillus daejeonensis]|uniref:BlaI/MecI/CopY family transcriptional regulator n=1 Tax=Paenibacillus daejeonensis TaxID=135193 RepID=UPI0003684C3F|nr:BlaI/MecI/CopY family transcriptional regulator [Paenibacillus daejeonensis]